MCQNNFFYALHDNARPGPGAFYLKAPVRETPTSTTFKNQQRWRLIMSKTVEEINRKILNKTVRVVTADRMPEIVEELGAERAAVEVDVVTTGTFGAMCSSGVWLNFGHSDPPIKMTPRLAQRRRGLCRRGGGRRLPGRHAGLGDPGHGVRRRPCHRGPAAGQAGGAARRFLRHATAIRARSWSPRSPWPTSTRRC